MDGGDGGVDEGIVVAVVADGEVEAGADMVVGDAGVEVEEVGGEVALLGRQELEVR